MDGNVLQTFVVLISAVGIIAGIMLLVKKISMKRMENRATINLSVISKITLQPKNHLFVVKAANKILILGVTDNSINILTELDPQSDESGSSDKINLNNADDLLKNVVSSVSNTNIKELNNDLSFVNFIKSSLKLK